MLFRPIHTLGFIGNQGGPGVLVGLLFFLPVLGLYFAMKDFRRQQKIAFAEGRELSWKDFLWELGHNDMILYWFCFLGWMGFAVGVALMVFLVTSELSGNLFKVLGSVLLVIGGFMLGRRGEKGLKNQFKNRRRRRREAIKARKTPKK